MKKKRLQGEREETMIIMVDMSPTDRFILYTSIDILLLFTVRASTDAGLRDECVLCQLVVGVACGRGHVIIRCVFDRLIIVKVP